MKQSVCAVFDIDDTLYLERDYVRSGFESTGIWAAKWLGCEDFAERCWKHFMDGHRGSIFDKVVQELQGCPNPELISTLVEIYRTHLPAISLAEDAAEALQSISLIAPIAVISDGPITSQSQKANALELGRFAFPVLLTGIFGRQFHKPHPRSFQYVQQTHSARAYFYIADNPHKDFTAPKELGWVTVRVRRPEGLYSKDENQQVTPDHELVSCAGLTELLRSFL